MRRRQFVRGHCAEAADRRSLLLAGLGAVFSMAQPRVARAEVDRGVSDWVASDHARVRLIDAGAVPSGRLAGLEVQLDPSFLTYWRTPGEAGVPPTARFDGSQNLASAALAFPAPQRFDEGGAEAFGYKDQVIFPLAVVPADLRRPVSLTVSLSFAVCSDLCLPAHADLRLDLDGSGDIPEAALVRDAVQHVPVPLLLGGAGPLAVLSVESGASPDRVRVTVRTPAGTVPNLFVEAGDPWYLQAGPAVAIGTGLASFELRVLSGAKVPARIPVTLTLTTDQSAVETAAQLDAAAPVP